MALPGTPEAPPSHDGPVDLSPEARRREAAQSSRLRDRLRNGKERRELLSGCKVVLKRAMVGIYNDGPIHAGNLAYLSMLAIFPFFLTGAAALSLLGEEAEQAAAVNAVLAAMPPVVADVLRPVALGAIDARSGWLLWVGGLIGLWTVGSLIETIRDILRRAYGTKATRAFWIYRLGSTAIIIGAVLVLMASLVAQVMIGAAQQAITAWMPELASALRQLAWSRIIATGGLFASIYLLFYALTPDPYRRSRYPKWPGALLTTLWWLAVSMALPPVLRSVFTYDLTYGSLAGSMIALFFFWLVGLGMVAGAELNAALAEPEGMEPDGTGTQMSQSQSEEGAQ